VLEAARSLSEHRVAFKLDLVGDGRDLDEFRSASVRLGLRQDQVKFHGRLAHDQALAVVGRAHVGLVPHRATPSWNSTIPNKLFDYMAAGLAVVSSDAIPAARVVRDTGAGLVFRSGDGRDLAEHLLKLLNLPAWDRYRQAGQEAVRSQYNWEVDTRRLLDLVAEVGAPRPKRDRG
jgi:glycosyltransferase involved in cell wall biosynthesis